VLEALQIYAGRANPALLDSIALAHDETRQDLFTGRHLPTDDTADLAIQIGPKGKAKSTPAETVSIPADPFMQQDSPLPCGVVQTRWMSMDELADAWDRIVFTEHEDIVRRALKIITPEFENLTFVRIDDGRADPLKQNMPPLRRSAKVKLANTPAPVALKSLGDGMLRILQIALQLVEARGGFLLIDEFENGLHYSVQEKVWSLLFEMATQLDLQIFATTHSWDCIDSFSKASLARQDVEGVLFRVGRSVLTSDRGRVIATVFDEEALYSVTQSDVEVR
jgi:AAA domain, putative AbiEii toxin, Type IV TA system